MSLKSFNIDRFKNQKPPKDNSLTTLSEIQALSKIPINKSFISKNDDISKEFNSIVKDEDIDKLIDESSHIILKLKKHFNRPRPKDLAKDFGIKLENVELKSMQTPSYPSGHSAQAYLISEHLKSKYPNKFRELDKKAKDISDSRNVARAHYKSDSEFGKKLGLEMFNFIKNGKRS
tara:strand:+ start:131 stop:658 length:528 start_codon:yes stop_codon:yes gene_type:complete